MATKSKVKASKARVTKKVDDSTPEALAVRSQHRQWAETMRNSRSASKRREASNAIYKAFYSPLIYYFMRKIGVNAELLDLQDLAMTTLEKVFSKIKQYNPESAAFSTWVYRIALNTLIDTKRSGKGIDVVSVESINAHNVKTMGEADAELFELSSTDRDPSQYAERTETHSRVRAAIKELQNKSERRVIELRFLEEYSYEEIAEALEMPMGTVKALLFRAKDRLQISLSKELEMA